MKLRTGLFFTKNDELYTIIHYKDKWFLVKTTSHPNLFVETIEGYLNAVERYQEGMYFNSTSTFPVKSETLEDFNFLLDLRDCIQIEGREKEDYDKEDIFTIPIWEDLIFTLIKKGTKKSKKALEKKAIETFARRTVRPRFNEKDYQETLIELEKYGNIELIEEFKLYADKLREVTKEFMSLKDELKLIDIESGRILYDNRTSTK